MKVDLSIIILSYNTNKLTQQCLSSLFDSLSKNKPLKTEVIVIDNGSRDRSVEKLKAQNSKLKPSESEGKTTNKNSNISFKLILNKRNLGYPKGNNQGLKITSGKYILFLNSDTIADKINFPALIEYFEDNPKVAVLTVKVVLPNGELDPAAHRGFPTIWNSFCYLMGLENIFKYIPFINKIFGGYHLVHLDQNFTHEIDSPSGAFYLVRADLIKSLGGFDEQFFMYGEDLDLSYRIKQLGYKILYYPHFSIAHLKHASGLEQNDTITRSSTKRHFFNAMKIFYKKHYEDNNSSLVNRFVYYAIDFLKQIS